MNNPNTADKCTITFHKGYLIICSSCGVIAHYGKKPKDGDDSLDLMKKAKFCPMCGLEIKEKKS